jgi:predicted DNA repair protein MutK
MSGLIALLDDVAGIAKIAAASVDDVASQALKAGSKAAGAVIDDAANCRSFGASRAARCSTSY